METRTYPEFSSRYPLTLRTIMMRPVRTYPDDLGIVYRSDTGQYYRFTWKQWYGRTCQLAHALQNKLGIKAGGPDQPGDRVATMALNHHRHVELCYAPSCIGAVAHPINIRLSMDHIVYTINHAEDIVIFVDDGKVATAIAAEHHVDGAVAGHEDQIVAVTAGDPVDTLAAADGVGAGATADAVSARSGEDPVRAGPPVDQVGAGESEDDVRSRATDQRVGIGCAHDDIGREGRRAGGHGGRGDEGDEAEGQDRKPDPAEMATRHARVLQVADVRGPGPSR